MVSLARRNIFAAADIGGCCLGQLSVAVGGLGRWGNGFGGERSGFHQLSVAGLRADHRESCQRTSVS